MIIWDKNGGDNQKFRIKRVAEGVFEFHTAWGRNLHISGGGTGNGTKIVTWDANDHENSRFRILQVINYDNLTAVK
jgi:hypothetical protein